MGPSLSVILPVRNSKQGLAQKIKDLLEVVADLSAELEFLIVDQGSTDGSGEIARELCRRYPQVKLLRHPHPLDHLELVETGLENTTGEVVMIHHDVNLPIRLDAIRQFWTSCDEQPVASQAQTVPPPPYSPPFASRGTQVLRRETLSKLRYHEAEPQAVRSIRADAGEGETSYHATTWKRVSNPQVPNGT